MRRLTRKKMLAAELYGYSYDNYAAHRGNIRFDRLMPDDVDSLERAEREQWELSRLADALELPEEKATQWQRSYQEAKDIVDAPTPAEAFRRGVRYSIQHAIAGGLSDQASIERLITQICYRAADLGFLLDMERQRLSDYSKELRTETEYDLEANRQAIEQALREMEAQNKDQDV